MTRLATLRDRAVEAAPKLNERDAATVLDILSRAGRYGDVTDRQAAYVESLLSRAERPKAEPKKVDLTRVNELFDRSTARLKKPFCVFGTYRKVDGKDLLDHEFKISKAPATGTNPGSLYVKRNGTYVGKIARDGTFQASREASQDVLGALETFAADPMASAVAYGQATGNCSRCGIKLTNPVSVAVGMGPICRSFFE